MILNLKKTDDDKTKAEILAKYFSSVFTEEPEGEIPNQNPINIKEKMPELIINEEMVLKQLNSLKIDKLLGPDELHSRFLLGTDHLTCRRGDGGYGFLFRSEFFFGQHES